MGFRVSAMSASWFSVAFVEWLVSLHEFAGLSPLLERLDQIDDIPRPGKASTRALVIVGTVPNCWMMHSAWQPWHTHGILIGNHGIAAIGLRQPCNMECTR